jgi:RNA polymerase sigma-70 factor (ECF subfamily)
MRPDMAETDEALAQRALTDRDAFGELARRYADRIFNLAYRMTGDRAEAEDLAQDAFVRAYRGLAGFKPGNAFGAWLYRIAVNVCLTHRQRRGAAIVEPLPEDGEAILDTAIPVAELVEQREVQAAVQRAILSLPPMYRAVVILYHMEGRGYNEIAELLDLPMNTVRTHLHRGRALLRERLAGTNPQ